jgi:hypothetical protein
MSWKIKRAPLDIEGALAAEAKGSRPPYQGNAQAELLATGWECCARGDRIYRIIREMDMPPTEVGVWMIIAGRTSASVFIYDVLVDVVSWRDSDEDDNGPMRTYEPHWVMKVDVRRSYIDESEHEEPHWINPPVEQSSIMLVPALALRDAVRRVLDPLPRLWPIRDSKPKPPDAAASSPPHDS